MNSKKQEKQSQLLKPSDLALLGFVIDQERGKGEKLMTGHKLRVEISPRHIRIKMGGCSCALVQTNEYSVDDMRALLHGLKATK